MYIKYLKLTTKITANKRSSEILEVSEGEKGKSVQLHIQCKIRKRENHRETEKYVYCIQYGKKLPKYVSDYNKCCWTGPNK